EIHDAELHESDRTQVGRVIGAGYLATVLVQVGQGQICGRQVTDQTAGAAVIRRIENSSPHYHRIADGTYRRQPGTAPSHFIQGTHGKRQPTDFQHAKQQGEQQHTDDGEL